MPAGLTGSPGGSYTPDDALGGSSDIFGQPYVGPPPPAPSVPSSRSNFNPYAPQTSAPNPNTPSGSPLNSGAVATLTPYTWAVAFLQALGAPTTGTNIEFIMSWEAAEGGNWGNSATYNPLNTTQPGFGGVAMNSVGVKAYPTWEAGLQANITAIRNGLYNNVVQLLQQGSAPVQELADAVSSGPWGTQQFNGGAAGTQSNWNGGTIDPNVGIGNAGVGLNSPYVTDPYQNVAVPTLSLDSLRSQYPLVAAVITAVPELQNIFNNAVSQNWSTDRFIAAVQNSNWWKTHSDTARQMFALMLSDPASYQQQVSNLEATLNNFAAQLGAIPSAKDVLNLAVDALTNGYDQNQAQLRQKFAQFVTPVSGLHFAGEAGSDESQLRSAMLSLGVFLPEATLDQNLRNIVAGNTDVNSVIAQLRTQAAKQFPAYASQINQGINTSDIADPYIQQAEQLLEQGPGQVNIQNPLIQKTLQAPSPVSLTDFENTVRQQPQWLQTANARDSIMAAAHQVLQNFGFTY